MSKKTYMPEAAIQKLENWSAKQISELLGDDAGRVAGQFCLLLRSYRIASNVAVVAWKLVEELEQTGQVKHGTLVELKERLHRFAPEARAFQPPSFLQELANRVLEEAYNALEERGAPEALLEPLFRYIAEQTRKETSDAG